MHRHIVDPEGIGQDFHRLGHQRVEREIDEEPDHRRVDHQAVRQRVRDRPEARLDVPAPGEVAVEEVGEQRDQVDERPQQRRVDGGLEPDREAGQEPLLSRHEGHRPDGLRLGKR